MKKKTLIIIIFTFFIKYIKASQINSNHSYFRNSIFLSDYEIKIKGNADTKLFTMDYKNLSTNLKNLINISMSIEISGKIDDITNYGFKTSFNYSEQYQKENMFFLYLKSFLGKIEIGNLLSAIEQSRIGGDSLDAGACSAHIEFPKIILKTELPIKHFILLKEGGLFEQNLGLFFNFTKPNKIDYLKYRTKINYYSPEFFGFKIFFNYLPNLSIDKDLTKTDIEEKVYLLDHFIGYGISYINTFDVFGLGFFIAQERNFSLEAIASLFKKDEKKLNNNSLVFNTFGINLNYFDITLSFSMGFISNSLFLEDNDINKYTSGKYINIGIGYEVGSIALSYNYYMSNITNDKTQLNKYNSHSAGAEFKLNKNISFYGEVVKYKIENLVEKKTIDNIFIAIGLTIKFY